MGPMLARLTNSLALARRSAMLPLAARAVSTQATSIAGSSSALLALWLSPPQSTPEVVKVLKEQHQLSNSGLYMNLPPASVPIWGPPPRTEIVGE